MYHLSALFNDADHLLRLNSVGDRWNIGKIILTGENRSTLRKACPCVSFLTSDPS
jgi:hypothetical protein